MKLRQIELQEVGVHRELVLSNLGDGLTVLYGPNETGKSTLLASLRGLLFGRAEMAEGKPTMSAQSRAAAMIEASDGGLWRLERNLSSRRTKPAVVSPNGDRFTGDHAIKDGLPELRMVEASLYQSVFTFQLAELRDLQGETGVADKLYAVGSPGGLSPYELERRLADAARALFNPDPRARNAKLLQWQKEVARLRDEREAAQDTPAAYLRAQAELRDAQVVQAELEAALREATAQRAAAQLLLDLWPHYRSLSVWQTRSGSDTRVTPTWLGLREAVGGLTADAQRVALQLEQMRSAAQEAADVAGEAQNALLHLSSPWTTVTADGTRAVDTVTVDSAVIEQARAHAVKMEQCTRDVEGFSRSAAANREVMRQRLGYLEAAGGSGEAGAADWAATREREGAARARLQDDADTLTRAQALWSRCEEHLDELEAAKIGREQATLAAHVQRRQRSTWVAVAAVGIAVLFGGWIWHTGSQAAAFVAVALGVTVAAAWMWRGRSETQQGAANGPDVAWLDAAARTQWQALRDCLAGLMTVDVWPSQTAQAQWAVFAQTLPTDRGAVHTAFGQLREAMRQTRATIDAQSQQTVARRDAWERWQDANRVLAEDEARYRAAMAERNLVQEAWEAQLQTFGLSGSVSPSTFVTEASRVVELRCAQVTAARKRASVAAAGQSVAAFLDRAAAVIERVRTEVPDSAGISHDLGTSSGAQVESAAGGEARAQSDAGPDSAAAHARVQGWIGSISNGELSTDGLAVWAHLDAAVRTLQPVLAAAKARLDEWAQAALQARETRLQAVTLAGGEDAYEALVSTLTSVTEDDLQVRLEDAVSALETAHTRADAQRQRVWAVEQSLSQWPDRDAASAAAWQLAQATAERDRVAGTWSVYAAAGALVREARRRYEHNRQPAALQSAGEVFAAVTDGRYTELRSTATVDAKNGVPTPLLVAVDGRGQAWSVEQLSRGAREQVYLALRLALLRDYAARGVVLPVVLDDPLVNFDAARFDAVFAILKEEAKSGQFLYLTCHDDVAAMAVDTGVPVIDLTTVAKKE